MLYSSTAIQRSRARRRRSSMGFGHHPLLAFLDNTSEALAGMLRPGNAGANTAADHIQLVDEALAQIPEPDRYGQPILVRADGAGCTKAWLNHLRGLRYDAGLDVSFLVGFTVPDVVLPDEPVDAGGAEPVGECVDGLDEPVYDVFSATSTSPWRSGGRRTRENASSPHGPGC